MANVSSNWENLSIYYANLSSIYLCSCFFTLIALFSTWWFRRKENVEKIRESQIEKTVTPRGSGVWSKKATNNIISKHNSENFEVEEKDEVVMEARRLAAESLTSEHSVMRQVKTARHSAIERQLTAGLSEEQLRKERETQASQLEAIYKLLKEKEEQFQIKSMDELQDQLRLYRT